MLPEWTNSFLPMELAVSSRVAAACCVETTRGRHFMCAVSFFNIFCHETEILPARRKFTITLQSRNFGEVLGVITITPLSWNKGDNIFFLLYKVKFSERDGQNFKFFGPLIGTAAVDEKFHSDFVNFTLKNSLNAPKNIKIFVIASPMERTTIFSEKLVLSLTNFRLPQTFLCHPLWDVS